MSTITRSDSIPSADALHVAPFEISVSDEVLADLAERLRRTRLPPAAPGPAWSQGSDLDHMRTVLDAWRASFDWRAHERALNTFAHFRVRVDGHEHHFVHQRAADGQGIPLLLLHGWPSTFVELLPLVPRLTRPAEGPSFDLVIPSLPGYCFSERPEQQWTMRDTARLWHRVMQALGHRRYAVHGGDLGAGIATFMALEQPDAVIGVHLSNLELSPYLGPGAPPLTEAERALLEQEERWLRAEGGYQAIQSTKPQSLAYGLTDSPIGLAAWILEKWRTWSDCGGELSRRFSMDSLLTTIMLYWVTGCIGTSVRDYHDNVELYEAFGPTDRVRVPTAVAMFGNELVDDGTFPREWAERLYDVHRWTVMPSGGHFAAMEEPDALAGDISAFFGGLPR